jgi:biofilm PGA synthesis N-glycosyltransferase PgaC
MRRSFSNLFGNVVWFFGAFACYKKSVIKKIGFFKGGIMGEDMNTLLSIYRAGYKIKNVHNAFVYTTVPDTLKGFFRQRIRWWVAALDSLKRNKSLFSIKSNASMLYLFFNHYWWTFYTLISLPIFTYQVAYWLPYNNQNFVSLFMYFFRWISLLGPIYVIYKIPVWGVSLYNIFGVVSGIVSLILMLSAIFLFKGKLNFKTVAAVLFYFPYTLLLNLTVFVSVIKRMFLKRKYFISQYPTATKI